MLPDDLQLLALPVLAHRVLPTAEAQIGRRTADAIVADIVRRVPVPRSVDTPPVRTGPARGA